MKVDGGRGGHHGSDPVGAGRGSSDARFGVRAGMAFGLLGASAATRAQLMQMMEGVTDLARRRLQVSVEPGPAWDVLVDALLNRFPWLDDDEAEDDGEEPKGFSVYARTARFFGHDGDWFHPMEGDPGAARRSPNDPLWIVEALAVVDGVSRPRADRELVRGASCRRAAFIVDPRAHATELELPDPYPLGRSWPSWRTTSRPSRCTVRAVHPHGERGVRPRYARTRNSRVR